jgi:hypothetical protein
MRLSPKIKLLAALLAISLGVSDLAFAWPPTYGSEFNFTSDKIQSAFRARKRTARKNPAWDKPTETEAGVARKFAEKVKEKCGDDCTITEHTGKFQLKEFRVTFKNGYSFNIASDPACVEIQTEPENLERIKKYQAVTQEFIFNVAKELNLYGAGETAHFNVGLLSAFDGDAMGFLRFFVNYHNLQELATGALGEDEANAPPISHLQPQQRAGLSRLVNETNRGYFSRPQDVANRIKSSVYTATPIYEDAVDKGHYQGVSVKYIDSNTRSSRDKPFELRVPRQPESAEERTLLAELMEKRIAFEKKQIGPIAFLDVAKVEKYSKSDLANAFRLFLAEMIEDWSEAKMKEDWNHFKPLLPKSLQKIPPDAFMSGKIDWNSAKDIRNLKVYMKHIPSSAWVRDRMNLLLQSPEAQASGKVPALLAEAEGLLGEHANSHARDAMRAFVQSQGAPGGPATLPAPMAREGCEHGFAHFGRPVPIQ